MFCPPYLPTDVQAQPEDQADIAMEDHATSVDDQSQPKQEHTQHIQPPINPVQWWTKFPPPQRQAQSYAKETLLRQFQILGDILNAGTLLIDVRRDDYLGGSIRGSLNLPAQSFYQNMATLYRLCKGDGVNVISRVMFYCGTDLSSLPQNTQSLAMYSLAPSIGSSSGRAPRCAAWFADYVAQRAESEGVPENMAEPQCYVLEGGIKGWVAGGGPFRHLVDGYEEAYWLGFAEVKTVGKRLQNREEGEDEEDCMQEDGYDGMMQGNVARRKVLPLPQR